MRPPFGIIGLAILVAGCATATPPWPPLAEPLASPEIALPYRWAPFKWVRGAYLTYDIQSFSETAIAGRTERRSEQDRFQLKAVDRTSQGLVRVELTADGKRIGDLYVGEDGEVKDMAVSPSDPAEALLMKGLLKMAQSPIFRRAARDPFTLHEPRRFEFRLSEFVPLNEFFGPTCSLDEEPSMVAVVTFTGHKRLGHTRAVELQSSGSMARLALACEEGAERLELLVGVTADGKEYFGELGYQVASYQVMTMTGETVMKGQRQRMVLRSITSVTLDLAHSGGF